MQEKGILNRYSLLDPLEPLGRLKSSCPLISMFVLFVVCRSSTKCWTQTPKYLELHFHQRLGRNGFDWKRTCAVEMILSTPANDYTNSTKYTSRERCMKQVFLKVIIRRAPWSHCREQTDPWAIWSKKLFTPFWRGVNGVQSPKHRDSEKHWVQTPHDLLKQWISPSWWLSKITYIVKGLWSVQLTLLCSTICFYIGNTPCCCWSFCRSKECTL